jgi:hypothetical protein
MFISCLYAVRDALVSTQAADLLNEYEEDLVGWAYEAEKKILDTTQASGQLMKDNIVCLYTFNNQVCLPQGFNGLICLKVNQVIPTLINYTTCRIKPNITCPNANGVAGLSMRIDQRIVTFSPAVPDGQPVTVEYQSIRLEGEDGYPMIYDEHQYAISMFLQYKIYATIKPNETLSQVRKLEWSRECLQARARTNQLTPEQMASLGSVWYVNGAVGVRGRGNRGISNIWD